LGLQVFVLPFPPAFVASEIGFVIALVGSVIALAKPTPSPRPLVTAEDRSAAPLPPSNKLKSPTTPTGSVAKVSLNFSPEPYLSLKNSATSRTNCSFLCSPGIKVLTIPSLKLYRLDTVLGILRSDAISEAKRPALGKKFDAALLNSGLACSCSVALCDLKSLYSSVTFAYFGFL